MEKKFKYCQIDYPCYPSEGNLNKLGEIGWELVCIETFENELFDKIFEKFYKQKTYKATFKREIVYESL
jgi:hypothetical protein